MLPFWVFSPAVAPLLPLDLLLDPAMLAATGLLQVGYGATIAFVLFRLIDRYSFHDN